MNSSNKPAAKSRFTRPDFSGLVKLRREWRAFHERQDRVNADQVFRQAGIELISERDLEPLPQVFRLKLNEFGRDWERTLAAQALREHFSFYRVQLSIGVEEVTVLHAWIETALDPNGASLFFESNGLQALTDGIWDSVFYFTLRAEIPPASVGLEKAPGVRSSGKILRIA